MLTMNDNDWKKLEKLRAEMEDHVSKPTFLTRTRIRYWLTLFPEIPKPCTCKAGCYQCDPLAHCRTCKEFMGHGHECAPNHD